MLTVGGQGEVAFSGSETITVFRSSPRAERGFCRICGTYRFYRLVSGKLLEIPVGLRGDAARWTLAQQIFIDEKPAFSAFANETRMLTGADVFAAHPPSAP